MDKKYKLNIGDMVTLTFHTSNVVRYSLKLLYTPAEPGDIWIFLDERQNVVYYVSENCTVSKTIT